MDSRNEFEIALEKILNDTSHNFVKASKLMELSNTLLQRATVGEQDLDTREIYLKVSRHCLENAIKLFNVTPKQNLDPSNLFDIAANTRACHMGLIHNLLVSQDNYINRLNYKEVAQHFFQYCNLLKRTKNIIHYLQDEALYSSLKQNIQMLFSIANAMINISTQATATCLTSLAGVLKSAIQQEQKSTDNPEHIKFFQNVLLDIIKLQAERLESTPNQENESNSQNSGNHIEQNHFNEIISPYLQALEIGYKLHVSLTSASSNPGEYSTEVDLDQTIKDLDKAMRAFEKALKGFYHLIKTLELKTNQLLTLHILINRAQMGLVAILLLYPKQMNKLDYEQITDHFIASCNIFKEPKFCALYLKANGPKTFLNEIQVLIQNADAIKARNPQESLICYENIVNILETLISLNKYYPKLNLINAETVKLFLNEFEMINKNIIDCYINSDKAFSHSPSKVEGLALYNRRLYNILSENNLFIHTKNSADHFKKIAIYFQQHNAPLEEKIALAHLKNLTQIIEHPELSNKLAKTQTRLSLKENRPRSSSSTKKTSEAFFKVPHIDKEEDTSGIKNNADASTSILFSLETPKKETPKKETPKKKY